MACGIHKGLDFDAYLSEPGLSKSAVTKLMVSQAHYDAYIRGKFKPTPDMKFGSDVDRAVFEPDKPLAEYNLKTKSGQAYHDALHGMLDALDRAKTASQLLSGGDAQVSMFWEAENGVMIKGRPDYMREDWSVFVDYKTTTRADWFKWRWIAKDTGADTQAAIAVDGARVLGEGSYDFIFVVQERKPPYAVAVYESPPAMLESGRAKYRMAIPLYKEYWEDGICRGYPDEVIENLEW